MAQHLGIEKKYSNDPVLTIYSTNTSPAFNVPRAAERVTFQTSPAVPSVVASTAVTVTPFAFVLKSFWPTMIVSPGNGM